MTQKVKKLNDAAIPRLTEIADDALVTVTDKTTGAISNIEFSKLKSQLFKNVSSRNLIANSGVESPVITTLASKQYQLVEPLDPNRKYMLAFCASGTAATVRPVVGTNSPSQDFFSPNSFVFNGQKVVLVKEIINPLGANAIRFWGGNNDLTVHWCTLVEGEVPLTIWQPAPEDFWGG